MSVYETSKLFSEAFIYFWSTLLKMVQEDTITLEQMESECWIELATQDKIYKMRIDNLRSLARQTKIINENGVIQRDTREPIFEIVETAFANQH